MALTKDVLPRAMIEVGQRLLDQYEEIMTGVKLATSISGRKTKTVYHYTDYLGLVGILKNGTIKFRDILKQNDTSELRYGVEAGLAAFEADCGSMEVAGVPIFQKYRDDISAQLVRYGEHFIFCASQDGNLLDQWRAYADDGRGFVLAFSREKLEAAILKNTGEGVLNSMAIDYNPETLLTRQKRLIGPLRAALINHIPNETAGLPHDKFLENFRILVDACLDHALMNNLYVSIVSKHPAYKNEAEFRYLLTQPAPKDGQAKESVFVNWRAYDATTLEGICVGPAANKDLAGALVQALLHEFKYNEEKVPVSFSDIPYQSFRR